MWSMNSSVSMQQRAASFCPDWTYSLSGSWMEEWCIVPYVIAHISVHGWAHGRGVEGGRVHGKDEIIQKSFLQAGSGLEMLSKRMSWIWTHTTLCCDRFGGSWLQRSFYVQIVAVLWIQHRGIDREYNFQGNLIASTSHLALFGMTYNFFCA
jgi:hypothetical protein